MGRKLKQTEHHPSIYFQIFDEDIWSMLDKLMTLPKYAKSRTSLLNNALAYGLPKLIETEFGEKTLNDENDEQPTEKPTVRITESVHDERIDEVVRLLQEIIMNTHISKSLLCLYTGLRIGELLALTWHDIDFIKGTLAVTKSCHYGKGESGKFERCTELPKTITSRRTIPIPKQMITILKGIKKRSESEYVIASRTDPVSVRSYQRSFALLLQRLKVPHKGFHALRHTFATRALECGMDVKTLSEILGHKNASITLNRYVHSLMEHKQEMMNKVGKLLQ